jgi:hypothetical protein
VRIAILTIVGLAAACLGCGGAPARPTRAEPDSAGTYDLGAPRSIPIGASWNEVSVFEREQRRTTRLTSNEEAEVERERIELTGRMTLVAANQASIRVASLTRDDGTGPQPLVAAGSELVVTHGPGGGITVAGAALAAELDEHVRRVVHVSTSAGGGDEGAGVAFEPPGGRAAIGQSWVFDDAALGALFSANRHGATVRREDVGGGAVLRERAPWEGHDCFELHFDAAIHDMALPLPEGAVLDDVEARMSGDYAWPLDLGVPSPTETSELSMTMEMHVETPAGLVRITGTFAEHRTRRRSDFRLP